MHTAEDNQLTIVVDEHFSQLVRSHVTFTVSKLLLTFWYTEKVHILNQKEMFRQCSLVTLLIKKVSKQFGVPIGVVCSTLIQFALIRKITLNNVK